MGWLILVVIVGFLSVVQGLDKIITKQQALFDMIARLADADRERRGGRP